ncbi:prepilin-type N-terminal cleavage/methylation domain-containing protein [bacterium]|nr:MAG: prepilin-type N-terminal cleavage/methylation domain-containing protein [bacterium]
MDRPIARWAAVINVRRGATLVELLTVVAILGVLGAILYPVLASARKKAGSTSAISRMRQLGAAGAVYATDHNVLPLRPAQLIGVLGVTKDLLALSEDPYPNGLGNRIAENQSVWGQKEVEKFKRTFVGQRDLSVSSYAAPLFVPEKNPGWLIDATPLKPSWPAPMAVWKGKYRLLRADGSVTLRHAPYIDCVNGGKSEPCIPAELQFVDPDEDFREWQKSLP